MKLFICLLTILMIFDSTEAAGKPLGSSTICDLKENSTSINIGEINADWIISDVDATAVRAAAIRIPLEDGCEIDFKAIGQYLEEVNIKLSIFNSNLIVNGSYKFNPQRPDYIPIFDPYTRSVNSPGNDLIILVDFKRVEGMFAGFQIGFPIVEMMRYSSELTDRKFIKDVEKILKDRHLTTGSNQVPVTIDVSTKCTTEPQLYLLPCKAPVILSLDDNYNRTMGQIDIICKAVSIDGSPEISWMLIQAGADEIPQTNISLITETRDQLTTTSTLHNVTAGNETVTYSCVAQNNNSGGGRAKREIHITASEGTTETSTATKTLLWGIVGAAVGAVAVVALGCVGLTKRRRRKGKKQGKLRGMEVVEDHVDISSSDDASWRTLSPVEPTYAEVTRKERPNKPHSPNIYNHLDRTMRTTSRDDFRTNRPPPKPPSTLAPRPSTLAPAPIREYEMEATSFGSTSEGHYEMQSLRL